MGFYTWVASAGNFAYNCSVTNVGSYQKLFRRFVSLLFVFDRLFITNIVINYLDGFLLNSFVDFVKFVIILFDTGCYLRCLVRHILTLKRNFGFHLRVGRGIRCA